MDSLQDEALPIYFQTLEMNDERLFQFRTDRLSRIGYKTKLLNKKSVLIGGVGLLGNEISYNLAVLGIGKLFIIDYGYVDWFNIYRQPLFSSTDVYKRKVDVVKEKLSEMGQIEVIPIFKEVPCFASDPVPNIIKENLRFLDDLVMNTDLSIGCFDIFSARAVLQMLCLVHNKPFISSALDANVGTVTLFRGRGNPCYCCGSPQGVFLDGGACTLSTLESQKILGGITTKFAVEYLMNIDIPHNHFVYYPKNLSTKYLTKTGSARCSVCGPDGILNYKDSYIDFIYNWLFER